MNSYPASPDRPWRSLAERDRFAAWQRGEFPPGADSAPDAVTRRQFLRLVGGGVALAGIAGCGAQPADEIVPYVRQPPESTPGVARAYATSLLRDGYAVGVLAVTHEGRPTRLDGNPDHPASRGATGAREQAEILALYDPCRATAVGYRGLPAAWDEAAAALRDAAGADGAGVHLLLEPASSPTLARHLDRLRERLPRCRVHWHTTAGHGDELEATTAVCGRPLLAQPDLASADCGLLLGGDLLTRGPWHLRHARGWATGRSPADPAAAMSRWYAAEATPTCTGFSADHRLRLDERDLPRLAAAVLAAIGAAQPQRFPAPVHQALAACPLGDLPTRWIRVVADDLASGGARSLVACGAQADRRLHVLVLALNAAIGSTAVAYRPCPLIGGERDGLADLAAALAGGAVDTLVIAGGNPLYSAPGDIPLAANLPRARRRFRLGSYVDETAAAADWFVPQVHTLERWGDARAYDGTLSMIQPAIQPLYGGKDAADLIAALLGDTAVDGRAWLRDTWADRGIAGDDFLRLLQRGCLDGSAAAPIVPSLDWDVVARAIADLAPAAPERLDLALQFDAKVHDGMDGNNGWLQELPDPVTKLTWDNALLMSPATAARFAVDSGQVVALTAGKEVIRVPVLVQPGQADATLALALGYGRSGSETVASGVGVSAFPLRRTDAPWLISDVSLAVLPDRHPLAVTQEHWAMEGRTAALSATRSAWEREPSLFTGRNAAQPSLRPPAERPSPQWGMVIDLAACTGCSACVVACQAENNIPVVGKDEVRRSREMHWLRIDRYYSGAIGEPAVVMQPMACQHCEKAPCEYVCPTYATAHSPDGLNEMTYNRCVGTRFCSNNCPYKVRRFNWYNYNEPKAPVVTLGRNPDVTVRQRGVMEKCTYCVQRIRASDIATRVDGVRPEVHTACQQACASGAIIFGDISDPSAAVARARSSPRAYAALVESGAEPRTRYLAAIRNPHPDLA